MCIKREEEKAKNIFKSANNNRTNYEIIVKTKMSAFKIEKAKSKLY